MRAAVEERVATGVTPRTALTHDLAARGRVRARRPQIALPDRTEMREHAVATAGARS